MKHSKMIGKDGKMRQKMLSTVSTFFVSFQTLGEDSSA